MIHFRDMTFCNNPNCTCGPERKLTEKVLNDADEWWGEPGAPICVGDVCGAKPPRRVWLQIVQWADDKTIEAHVTCDPTAGSHALSGHQRRAGGFNVLHTEELDPKQAAKIILDEGGVTL